MAKKKFTQEDLQQIKVATLTQESSPNDHKEPIHIPRAPRRPKTPCQTTIKIYKEDLLDLKQILIKKHAKNLADGVDKKVSMEDLLEEMIDIVKKKYDN